MALLDLSSMAEYFYLAVTDDVEKIFYLLFKVFEQFYEEILVLNNGCNTIYCTVSNMLAVELHC